VDTVRFRVGGDRSMQSHMRQHDGCGQRWWRFLRGPSWHDASVGVLAPLVAAIGTLRLVAMEALEARRRDDCLVERRGPEEQ
jgi:hypothetical protein